MEQQNEITKRLSYLGDLNQLVKACKACPLNDGFHLPVPGWGPLDPDLMIVGEAPGEEESHPRNYPESEYGVPFIGQAGQELRALMDKIGYYGISIHLTNTALHRPPNNRPPKPEEKAMCAPFLLGRLVIVKPKTIVALGKHAANSLREIAGLPQLDEKETHRGKDFRLQFNNVDAYVFSTYHPSYALLRNPPKAPDLESDLRNVLQYVLERKHDQSRISSEIS